jgi:anti-sigma factor RsiW
MKCPEFKNELFEYVEGSLAPGAKAAADGLLANCLACQNLLRREVQRAEILNAYFEHETRAITFSENRRQKILRAMPEKNKPSNLFPIRFVWPLGLAACLLVMAAVFWIRRAPAKEEFVAIETSYQIPVHKFERRGNMINDSISYETVVIEGTMQKERSKL